MATRGKLRASGASGAEEEAHEVEKTLTDPIEQPAPGEERRIFRAPAFQRMRLDWRSEDRVVLTGAQAAVRGRLTVIFEDAYDTMGRVYDIVRTPERDLATGEIKTDQFGYPIWARGPTGSFDEDWTRLGERQKEALLFEITTRLFEWTQRAADIWGEAMLAKAQFEERFAIDYDKPMTGTVDDRKAVGTAGSMDERYFALFVSTLSRKADGLVRSMELLAQRLKDSMAR